MHDVRILVADDDPEVRALLEVCFDDQSGFQLLGCVADGNQAVIQSRALRPDVLLCDIDMPVLDGLTVTQVLSKELPECVIVILSASLAKTHAQRAIEAGARDFIEKGVGLPMVPLRVLEILELMQAVADRASQRRAEITTAAKLFGFYGPKGAAGVTSLAVNSAIELVRAGQRTLLIDFNLQFGDVALMLNVREKVNISRLRPPSGARMDAAAIVEAAESHPTGLKVLYQSDLVESELITPDDIFGIIQTVRESSAFDFVLIDLPRSLDERTLAAIEPLDTLFVVANEDPFSLKNCRLARDLFIRLGISPLRIRVLLNKAGESPTPAVRHDLGEPFAYFPRSAELFEQSIRDGFPPVIAAPRSAFSQAIHRFVCETILLRKPAPPPAPKAGEAPRSGLFRTLMNWL